MPDIERKTISATEISALLGVSPYATPWMLYRRFHDAIEIDRIDADGRMEWGKKMQPLVLAKAAEDLALEIVDNGERYWRRGLLGATRDATVIRPDRGPGAFDAKCVFDYKIWMQNWDGGKAPPRHIELQLQQQMYVGDGEQPFDHGTIGVWICGDMKYFHRKPMPDLWDKMEEEARAFFAAVKEHRAPDPFGDAIEIPLLQKLDRMSNSTIDKSDDVELAETIRQYVWEQKQVSMAQKTAATLKARILAEMKDAEQLVAYGGIHVKAITRNVKEHMVRASSSITLKPYIPDALPDALMEGVAEAGETNA